MKTIVHKLPNGGIGNYPPNPRVVAVMMGTGVGWTTEQCAWEISKFMEPGSLESGWAGFPEAFATEWVLALCNGGLTEAEVLDLFTRRIQIRRGYTVSAVVDDAILPKQITSDRYFRDALVWNDASPTKCQCDMPKACIIYMNRIREVRNNKLAELDVLFMRAVESLDTVKQAQIAEQKQKLRDIPQTFDLTIAVTPEELKARWPAELA